MTTDNILVVVYFFSVLSAVFLKTNQNQSASYLLSDRKLTVLPFTSTLVTTAYGWILGTGELYYTHGFYAWLFLNLPYTLFSFVFAFFFAKKLHSQQLITMADLFHKHYNSSVATFASFIILIFTSPLMYVLMAANIINYFWQIPMVYCIIISVIFSVIYIFNGGFNAVVKTDILHFVLMFGGFIIVFFIFLYNYGFEPILLSQEKLSMPAEGKKIWYILSWYLFASITLADPNYHQRIHAAKNQNTVKKGILLAILCWIIFDFFAASLSLYVFWLNPSINNLSHVYLIAANNYLPVVAKGIFTIALLATVFSTSNSFFFTSAVTISKDILHRNNIFLKISLNKLTGFTLLLISVITIVVLLPYKNKTAVSLFFDITPYVVSGLLLPLLGAYYRKIKLPSTLVFVQMVIAIISTAIARISGSSINEVFYGVFVALFIQITGLIYIGVRRKYF